MLPSTALKSYLQLVFQNYRALQRGKNPSELLTVTFFERNSF